MCFALEFKYDWGRRGLAAIFIPDRRRSWWWPVLHCSTWSAGGSQPAEYQDIASLTSWHISHLTPLLRCKIEDFFVLIGLSTQYIGAWRSAGSVPASGSGGSPGPWIISTRTRFCVSMWDNEWGRLSLHSTILSAFSCQTRCKSSLSPDTPVATTTRRSRARTWPGVGGGSSSHKRTLLKQGTYLYKECVELRLDYQTNEIHWRWSEICEV